MVDVRALAAFVDAFRVSIKLPGSSPAEGSDHGSVVDWESLISLGLLQLKPDAFEPLEEDILPIDEQTEEQILRPYPSVRCFVRFQMFPNVSILTILSSCTLALFAMLSLRSVCSVKVKPVVLCGVEAFRPFTFRAP